jgi:LTXXQ motif family protein
MQVKKSILSLAIVSLFAATGAALACGPGPQGAGMGPHAGAPMDPAQHAERVQARLSGLKEALKLQPNQIDAWNAYEAKVKSEAQTRAQMRQSMQEQRGDAQAMADQHVTMMKHNAQAAEEVNGLRKALVATLSAEQKATFEQYAMGPRFARGAGADGGQGGFGPGYGPGGGGRGPGHGRGCAGAA